MRMEILHGHVPMFGAAVTKLIQCLLYFIANNEAGLSNDLCNECLVDFIKVFREAQVVERGHLFIRVPMFVPRYVFVSLQRTFEELISTLAMKAESGGAIVSSPLNGQGERGVEASVAMVDDVEAIPPGLVCKTTTSVVETSPERAPQVVQMDVPQTEVRYATAIIVDEAIY